MKTLSIVTLASIFLAGSLTAQEETSSLTNETVPGDGLLTAAQNRASLASEVEDSVESAQKALKELQTLKNPTGLPVGKDAGLGMAATDIGHHLLAAGKPTAAEVFFQAAEVSLSRAVEDTADEQAKEKAQYLQSLAQIRGNYLGKQKEAQEGMAAAAELQPDDEHLQRLSKIYSERLKAQENPGGKEATR